MDISDVPDMMCYVSSELSLAGTWDIVRCHVTEIDHITCVLLVSLVLHKHEP